jgi:MoaA/NifB/PqqE/SkfB family radical SAM enzyme
MASLGQGSKVILWGVGATYNKYGYIFREAYDVVALCDGDKDKCGKLYDGIECFTYDKIGETPVIVMMEKEGYIKEVTDYLESSNIEYYCFNDIFEKTYELYQEVMVEKYGDFIDVEPDNKFILNKFLDIGVAVHTCNLDCSYCYLPEKNPIKMMKSQVRNPKFVRMALSRKRLGGTALLNFCAAGETLLWKEAPETFYELLKEGHIISVITNGLLTKAIENILEVTGEYAKNLFFKFSFHYEQLKKKGMLDLFAENVKMVQRSKASFSVELMPCDELEPYIEEVMEFSLKNFGALPQLTIGRDEEDGFKLLTKHSKEEYERIWSVFESDMFKYKIKNYMKYERNCDAGKSSLHVNIYNGIIRKCVCEEVIGNIYSDLDRKLEYSPIDNACSAKYCFNNHAFVLLGCVRKDEEFTHSQIRDRVTLDGEHWVKENMRNNFSQKCFRNSLGEK